jgi:hypothetical protein
VTIGFKGVVRQCESKVEETGVVATRRFFAIPKGIGERDISFSVGLTKPG